MIRSMTGFGRFEFAGESHKIIVEMKSVNHRYLDLSIKMPKIFNCFETAIRSLVKEQLQRGKVDMYISYETESDDQTVLCYHEDIARDYMEGINMLSNMRLCSNVPAQSIVQTALGGYQSVKDYIVPGGRIYEQRECVYKMLNEIDGISVVKPKAAFYAFPRIDIKKFNITDDEKFALDFLREKKVLIVHGGGFNWQQPDHFRIVYLPRIEVLEESLTKLGEFLQTYHQ